MSIVVEFPQARFRIMLLWVWALDLLSSLSRYSKTSFGRHWLMICGGVSEPTSRIFPRIHL